MTKVLLKWLAFFIVAFLFGLIYTIPAHLALPYLPPDVQAGGIEGTVWNGQAQKLKLDNFDFGEVQWRIQPLHLLLGRLQAYVTFKQSNLRGQGDVTVKRGELDLEAFRVTGNTEFLSPYIAAYGASVNGPFELDIDSLQATAIGPQEAQGHLIWQNALLKTPAELALGDIEVELKQQGDIAIATLKGNGNALNLNGQADLKPGWQYTTNLKFEPTSDTPEQVRQTLALFGRPDARGAVVFSHNGALPITEIVPFLNDQEVEKE